MIQENTLRYSIYSTAFVIIMALTGIFTAFEEQMVIEGQLSFSAALLILMVGGTGYLVALPARERGWQTTVSNALIGSIIVGSALVILVAIETSINMRFVFQNLRSLNEGTLTFGKYVSISDGQLGGIFLLLGFSITLGIMIGFIVLLPQKERGMLLISFVLTVIIGLITQQVNEIIALPDTISLLIPFAMTYFIGYSWRTANNSLLPAPIAQIGEKPLSIQLAFGAVTGAIIGLIFIAPISAGAIEPDDIMGGNGSKAVILNAMPLILLATTIAMGAFGIMAQKSSQLIHNGTAYFMIALLLLGILDWQEDMTLLATSVTFILLCGLFWFVPLLGRQANKQFEISYPEDQRIVRYMFFAGAALILLVAPQFTGSYINNVLNLIALYTIMGIGLNVMIGYAGLLDLGYVASFAIGAYTLGLLTSPNVLTCGMVHPNDIPFQEIEATCKYTLTFWTAWPICVIVSALTGMMLGVPVLKMRGDYLAIVTLGFGQIMNVVVRSDAAKPLLGGPLGISPIESPILDMTRVNDDWYLKLGDFTSLYYLFLFGVVATAFVVYRLLNSRTGRAWRAVRSDEDVAEAMGIHLIGTKLLAFGVSSAFAGLGGALFAVMMKGIYPNSYNLMISINVLSLIIIGGMGSIPGVFVGALMLVGLPELLRELDIYRMLAFGALLVTVMLVKPEGLLPPRPAKLSELADKHKHRKRKPHLQEDSSNG
jgi:ABC-type branched-subunit amino acid transport system permease subunit